MKFMIAMTDPYNVIQKLAVTSMKITIIAEKD
jgi:hypothetical protein